MRGCNIEHPQGEKETKGSVEHTVQTRKTCAADLFEEADQAEITDRASEQGKSQRECEPRQPT